MTRDTAPTSVAAVAPTPMIHGARQVVVASLLWARVLRLAVRGHLSPPRLARALRRLRLARALAPLQNGRKGAFSSGRFHWDLYTPGWPSPVFDRSVEGEMDRLDPLSEHSAPLNVAYVAITRRCALRCEHCCEWDTLNLRESLTIGDLLEIVRRLLKQGVTKIFFSGGEPLQRFEDLLTLTAAAAARAEVWVFSSGRGLTAERAGRLHAVGLTGIVLSLDHWDAAAHDRFRGYAGAFEAVTEAATHARAANLLVALSLCPTRAFVAAENLERYVEHARALGASFVQIVEPRPVGHYAGRDVALGAEPQRVLERFAERMNTDRDTRDLPVVHYPDAIARRFGCWGAGDRFVYVDAGGDVHPCPFCRTPGVGALDGDFGETIAMLRAAGCPAIPGHGAERTCTRAPLGAAAGGG